MPSPSKQPKGTRRVDVYLPEAVATRLEALLHSESLGRIPKGALNAFIVARVNEFFNATRIPLGQYAGFHPQDWIAGDPAAIRRVALALAPLRRAPEGMDEAFPELNPGTGDNPTPGTGGA